MIKTKIEISEDELTILREIALANPKIVKKRKQARIYSVIVVISMAILAVLNFIDHSYGYGLFCLLFVVGFGWLAFEGGTTIQNLAYKKMQNKSDDRMKSGLRKYNFDIDGVIVLSEVGESKYKWDAFNCWGLFKNYVYLRKIDNQMILVKTDDLSKDEYDRLISILNEHLTQEKLVNNF